MPFLRKTIYTGKSAYSSYKIIDMNYYGRPSRVLFGDHKTPQSGMALDDAPELLFHYNQRLLEMMLSYASMKRALVIGGGVGMLPVAAYRHLPDLTLDVVEIDPLLTELAYRYFNFPKDKRMNVYNEDGAAFVAETNQKYDMICVDAFTGFVIPPHLFEVSTVKQYKRKLTKGGFVAVNLISEYKPYRRRLAHDMIDSFNEVFAHISLYQADPHDTPGVDQNFILVASDEPLSFDYLQSAEHELYVA